MSTSFNWQFLAKILRKFITRTINLTLGFLVSSIGCSVILITVTWALLLIEKCQNCYRVVDLL